MLNRIDHVQLIRNFPDVIYKMPINTSQENTTKGLQQFMQ